LPTYYIAGVVVVNLEAVSSTPAIVDVGVSAVVQRGLVGAALDVVERERAVDRPEEGLTSCRFGAAVPELLAHQVGLRGINIIAT
jgi:hypothetical protein